MVITSQISIDLQRPSYPAAINAVQGDQNTRQLEISMYSGSVAWQVPEAATVAMRYCKPDKTKGFYDTMPDGSSAFTVSGNTVSILLAPQILTVPGTVDAQVVLFLGAEILSTFVMQIHVEADPSAGVMESEDYTNWVQWIEAELDKYLEKVKVNGEFLGGSIIGSINMNGNPVYGLPAPIADDHAANMGFVNEQVKKAAPYNYAHNSDFTQFVAQAGVGGKHGKQSYAGDRWILDSGVVTGDARGDGEGYQNIKLNGTIRQKVANAPDVANAAIEMISGTASISYNNGEIVITSSGGTIKNVLLCADETLPKYRPKGYAAELEVCQRYFYKFDTDANGIYFWAAANSDQISGFLFSTEMHVAPTSNIIDLKIWDTRGFTSLINSISSKRATKGGFQYIQLTEKLPDNGLIAMIAEFLADIEEE